MDGPEHACEGDVEHVITDNADVNGLPEWPDACECGMSGCVKGTRGDEND